MINRCLSLFIYLNAIDIGNQLLSITSIIIDPPFEESCSPEEIQKPESRSVTRRTLERESRITEIRFLLFISRIIARNRVENSPLQLYPPQTTGI